MQLLYSEIEDHDPTLLDSLRDKEKLPEHRLIAALVISAIKEYNHKRPGLRHFARKWIESAHSRHVPYSLRFCLHHLGYDAERARRIVIFAASNYKELSRS